MEDPNRFKDSNILKEKWIFFLDKLKGLKNLTINKISGSVNNLKDRTNNIKFKDDLKRKFNIRHISLKKVLPIFMVIVISTFGLTIYKINEVRTRAYAVYLGEDKIGTVRTKEEVSDIMNEIQNKLQNTYNMDVLINKDLDFQNVHSKDKELSSHDELRKAINSKLTFLVGGYALLINEKEVGVLKSKQEAENIIKRFKESFNNAKNENSNIEKINLLENVKTTKVMTFMPQIKTEDEVLAVIEKGTDEVKEHIVEAGESYWTIAKEYNMTVDNLIKANPGVDPEKVYPGDKVNLIVPKPLLTAVTVEEVNYTESLNYDTKIELNSSMYKNEKKTKVEGKEGKSQVVAQIIKHNGVEVEKKIIKEEVIEKPLDEVIVKGTKEVPKTIATGVFRLPTRGFISSRYGMRNGRMHKGVDLAAKTGTSIVAADGGKVTFSGYSGDYGNLIIINHGNGYITKYGHCSKLLVKKGDKVYKGQKIAQVGSTGRTTGPHLHFEVLKNGVNKNPLNYLN